MAILENNRAHLKNKKTLLEKKMKTTHQFQETKGQFWKIKSNSRKKRVFLGSKSIQIDDNGTYNLTSSLQEWSFLDVSSQNKISKIFLGELFSHGSDILTLRFPKITPVVENFEKSWKRGWGKGGG